MDTCSILLSQLCPDIYFSCRRSEEIKSHLRFLEDVVFGGTYRERFESLRKFNDKWPRIEEMLKSFGTRAKGWDTEVDNIISLIRDTRSMFKLDPKEVNNIAKNWPSSLQDFEAKVEFGKFEQSNRLFINVYDKRNNEKLFQFSNFTENGYLKFGLVQPRMTSEWTIPNLKLPMKIMKIMKNISVGSTVTLGRQLVGSLIEIAINFCK